jgi:arylsulfatase A-like enzyme
LYRLVMADEQVGAIPTTAIELKTPNPTRWRRTDCADRFYTAHFIARRPAAATGRHPDRYGTFGPGAPIRAQELTVAKVLQSAGYATGHFGKWHLNGKNGDKNTTEIPGRAILASDPLSPGKMGFDEWVSADNFFDLDPVLGRNGVPEKFHGDSSDITTEVDFIRQQDCRRSLSRRRLVWLAVPHQALPADKAAYSALPEADRITTAIRCGSQRGPVADGCDLKVADNTLFWYCSDNGGNEGPKSTGNLRGSKGTLWEGGVRVPGIVEWPARIAKPFVLDAPCSTLDIYPTVLAATGAVAKNQIQPLDGLSLLPVFDRDRGARETHPILESRRQTTRHAALLDWPYCCTLPGRPHRKGKKAGETLPAVLLYDVSKDPKETTDLAAQEPERVAKMTAALEAWKASVEKSLAGADYSPTPAK